MKDRYDVEICVMNRPFNLKPIIRTASFRSKEKADKCIKKLDTHPNKFVWRIFKNGKEVESI